MNIANHYHEWFQQPKLDFLNKESKCIANIYNIAEAQVRGVYGSL
jgi:hypothetical protein